MKSREYRLLSGSIVVCVVCIYCYPLILPTPLLDPDEGLHAAISQEMVEQGDYLIPRIQGEPFLDKPILYFASQALSLRLFGMSEAAVRLPGLLFALLGVATTVLLARQLFDRSTALLTALVALTLVVPLALAQAAVHDVALIPWTNLLLLCWWAADRTTSSRRRFLLTLATAMLVALALLTKGLIGVAVVSVGYFLFVLVSRQLSLPLVMRFAAGLLLGSLLASPWFIAMEYSASGYLRYYFVERHFAGFATKTQCHGDAPWYYYLPILLVGSFPWNVYLGPGLWQTWTDQRRGHCQEAKAIAFVLCWLVGGLLFLSIAGSKLITYALPLFPAIAILVGHSLKRFLDHELSTNVESVFARLFQIVCAVGCIVPVAALVVIDKINHADSPAVAYLVALLASAVVFAAIMLLRQDRRHAAVAVGSLWFAICFVAVITWPLQKTAERHSGRYLGLQLAERPELPQNILLVGGRVASVVFYLTPEQRRNLHSGQLSTASLSDIAIWTRVPEDTLLAITDKELAKSNNPVIKRLAGSKTPEGSCHIVEQHTAITRTGKRRTW